MFTAHSYQERRNVLKKNMDRGILLFLGNIENPVNFEHNPYRFRQDSTFLYYFGIQEPRLAAVIDIDEDKTIVFGDELSIDDIVWMGKQETLKEKCLRSGVTETRSFSALATYLQNNKNRMVHYLPPYQPSNKILLTQLFSISVSAIQSSVSFITAVVKQREIKEDQEIREIEEAIRVSTEMHLLAMRLVRPGIREFEIANAIQHLAADQSCEMAYPPIVTINGGILHNHYRLNTLKSGDLFLNDSGAETAMGYAGDLTRTFPADPQFSTKQKEIYNIVLQSFTNARNALSPDINFKDIHLKACLALVEGLKSIGLMKGDAEEAVKAHAHTLFFNADSGI